MLSAVLQRLAPSIPRQSVMTFIRTAAPTLVRYNSSQPGSSSTRTVQSSFSSSPVFGATNDATSRPLRPNWMEASDRKNGPSWMGLYNDVKKQTRTQSPEEVWRQKELSIDPKRPNNAYSGRSVAVYGNDAAGAFGKLRRILSQNSVMQELRMAERHEKKGDKRRRLKSQRWRRRFAHEVRKKVQLVNEIRARGS
ncbi:hypothetical protein B0H21DRAFT_818376 [Amylocystis lapponica]|nr:hypothetical protein B0H21DRAFT_818376 [Amylocystis lapponica]